MRGCCPRFGLRPAFAPLEKLLVRCFRQWIGIGRNAPIDFHFEGSRLAHVLRLRQRDDDLSRTLAADRLLVQVAQGDPADDKGRSCGLNGDFFYALVRVWIRPRPEHEVLGPPGIDLGLVSADQVSRALAS